MSNQSSTSTTGGRRILSYVLFVIGVILAILGLVASPANWLLVIVGVAFLVVGYIFYRRGK